MHYREADDAYFAVLDEHTAVFQTLGRTQFPESYRAMFMFCAKTNSLKTAMFDCIDSNNPYAFKVLFRCFCEHYLKFMYVWARLLSESSDSVGTEYYSFCGALEAREYVSAMTMAEDLLGHSVTANVREALAELYPKAADLSDRELDEASRQFRYRSILRYFAGSTMKLVSADQPFLAQIVPLYATLSSFVHGGPYTDMEMAQYSEPRALQECEREVEVVFMMTATVFMFTAMAVSREHPEFAPVAPKVNRILKQFAAAHGET